MDLIGRLIGPMVVRNYFDFSLMQGPFAMCPVHLGQE